MSEYIKLDTGNMLVAGIDTGVTGAIAILDFYDPFKQAVVYKCPRTLDEMCELLANYVDTLSLAHIEQASNFGAGRASVGKLLVNFGQWQGLLKAALVETIIVTPDEWGKRQLGVIEHPKGTSKEARRKKKKALTLKKVRELFDSPHINLDKIDDNKADALLLALDARDNLIRLAIHEEKA